jgi:hypothetical protein
MHQLRLLQMRLGVAIRRQHRAAPQSGANRQGRQSGVRDKVERDCNAPGGLQLSMLR